MTAETLIRLFLPAQTHGTCRGCAAAIDWYETLTGKRMPMNRGAVAQRSETDPATGRVVAFFPASAAHWATCPAAAQFTKRPAARRA